MLNIFIVLVLAFAAFRGARRGLALQLVYSIGYLFVFIVAQKYYLHLVDFLELMIPYPQATPESNLVFYHGEQLFHLDRYFYAAISFALLLFVGWIIVRLIGIFCYELTFIPIIKEINGVLGAVLSVIVSLVALCILLNIVAMIPIGFIQNLFSGSFLAKMIVEHTVYFSDKLMDLWTSVPL